MVKILTFTKLGSKLEQKIKDARPDAELITVKESEADPIIPEADILVGFGGMLNWAHILPLAKNCRWVHTLSAGVDRLTAEPDFVAGDTILTNSKGIHGIPMGEHCLGVILGFTRKLFRTYDNQKEHRWETGIKGLDEIAGKTAVIVGLGAVGVGIAAKLKAMDMQVIGVKQNVTDLPGIDKVYGTADLDEALAQGDVVIVTLPVTPETRDLFNLERFKKMKSSAIFINVSRGETVVDDDLAAALKEGIIAGASLDVFRTEPLPQDNPLWDAPNLIVTPHDAAMSPMYLTRTINIFCENLKVFPDAAKMQNVVDKVRGY
ncbi:MAG: D-2-hydroxyacid dehydrogenase [Selenomonadaceae bacterium]|nr:D-2-hydroxyacid dehydrogenase [Selenomonadaceae bacterium]